MSMPDIRTSILGISISALNMRMALEMIDQWIAGREKHYVTVTPAHAVMDARHDPELRRIFNASGMTTPDGMAIVWILKLRGHRNVTRVYGPDLMLETCATGLEPGYRHFLYGGAEGVTSTLVERLQARFPGLRIVGTLTPPFRSLTEEEDRAAIDLINSASPDIVWPAPSRKVTLIPIEKLEHSAWSFGQHLEGDVRIINHDLEHPG